MVNPLPLMSKGESDLVVVAIKSKGGDCWHYDTYVVLDGNPLISNDKLYAEKSLFYVEKSSRTFMQISCREKFTHLYAEKSLFHVEKSSRTFMQRKVYFM